MDPFMTSGVYTPTDEDKAMWEKQEEQVVQPKISIVHNTIAPICYDCHASGDPDRRSTNIETSIVTSRSLAVLKYKCFNCNFVKEMSMDMKPGGLR